MRAGWRKLLVTILVLASGLALAGFGKLNDQAVRFLLGIVGAFVVGNSVERAAEGWKRPAEVADEPGEDVGP